MASNTFGNLFKVTTWGESHGKAIGVVIDGCPAGIALCEEEINRALAQRAPGKSAYTSTRAEPDHAQLLAGTLDDHTTGAPLSIIIYNHDADASSYEPIKHLLRPGHANYTYLQKYGCFDHRGGGRASARETACRVAAGVVARKIALTAGIEVIAYIKSIGSVDLEPACLSRVSLRQQLNNSRLFCPDAHAEQRMTQALTEASTAGDSLGGIVEFVGYDIPVGLGDPVYEKLEANLAKAMLSIPASKGFEIGEGFQAARMRGSQHNDAFTPDPQQRTATNHAGGTLAGISTGMPLCGRVAFKPTSSIKQAQRTTDMQGNSQTLLLPENARHDPCVAIRAVPVVEAMCYLVLADALLMNRNARMGHSA